MRILYYSDIHIEIRESETRFPWVLDSSTYPLDLGPNIEAFIGCIDLVILAGDIGTIRPRRGVTAQGYAEQVSKFLSAPVVLIPGNHEYYGGSLSEDREELLSGSWPGVTVLDRGVVNFPHPDGQLRILGATLWTDYALLGNPAQAMQRARSSIADHRRIEFDAGKPFQPEDALAEHVKSRQWLAIKLNETHVGPTIVVTHHVPHAAGRDPRFAANDPLSPTFASDCTDLLTLAGSAGVSAWIFGHNHYCLETTVWDVPLLSAQLGYPGEGTGWIGPQTITI